MARCPRCSGELETLLGCTACGALFPLEQDPGPFEVFGLRPAHAVDLPDLRRRLLRFSRLVHPDYFATAGEEEKLRAERASAFLNSAYAVLSDEAARADWLVSSLGGPDENGERSMPQEFLMEVLEWNEVLEEARQAGSGMESKLADLRRELEVRRKDSLDRAAKHLSPLPQAGSSLLREARRALNAVRYVDRTLAELEALRLSRAEAR